MKLKNSTVRLALFSVVVFIFQSTALWIYFSNAYIESRNTQQAIQLAKSTLPIFDAAGSSDEAKAIANKIKPTNGISYSVQRYEKNQGNNPDIREEEVGQEGMFTYITLYGNKEDMYSFIRFQFNNADLSPPEAPFLPLLAISLIITAIITVTYKILVMRKYDDTESVEFNNTTYQALMNFDIKTNKPDELKSSDPITREYNRILCEYDEQLIELQTQLTFTQKQESLANEKLQKVTDDMATLEKRYGEDLDQRAESLKNLAHQLNTPIGNICKEADILAAMLRNEDVSSEFAVNLRSIRNKCEIVQEYNKNVLSIARLQGGEYKETEKTFDLHKTITTILNTHQDTDINIIADIDGLPRDIRSIPNALTQALTCLYSNAIKYTQHGFVKVKGETVKKENGEASIVITVSDSGVGIPLEHQSTIFEQYGRGSQTDAMPGLGLGLFLAKELAKVLLNGQIELTDSEPGKGSTFTLSFSCTIEKINKGYKLPSHSSAIVSDSEEIAEAIVKSLEGLSIDVNVAQSDDQIKLPQTIVYAPTTETLIEKVLEDINTYREKMLENNGSVLACLPSKYMQQVASSVDSGIVKLIKQPLTQYNYAEAVRTKVVSRKQNQTLEVLIVDDQQANLDSLNSVLSNFDNVNVTTCKSGNLAITACRRKRFDVIILDWHMPGMNGEMTSLSIRADGLNKATPIILHTAHVEMGAGDLGGEHDEILPKTAGTSKIKETIESLTDIELYANSKKSDNPEQGIEHLAQKINELEDAIKSEKHNLINTYASQTISLANTFGEDRVAELCNTLRDDESGNPTILLQLTRDMRAAFKE